MYINPPPEGISLGRFGGGCAQRTSWPEMYREVSFPQTQTNSIARAASRAVENRVYREKYVKRNRFRVWCHPMGLKMAPTWSNMAGGGPRLQEHRSRQPLVRFVIGKDGAIELSELYCPPLAVCANLTWLASMMFLIAGPPFTVTFLPNVQYCNWYNANYDSV